MALTLMLPGAPPPSAAQLLQLEGAQAAPGEGEEPAEATLTRTGLLTVPSRLTLEHCCPIVPAHRGW